MKNSDKYLATMKTFNDEHLYNQSTGERLFDMNGGVAEAERLAELIRGLIPTHKRSPKFCEAMNGWANFITEAVNSSPEHLDWAVLQGSVYAGYELI